MDSFSNHRIICIAATIICAVLWLAAPFVAVNILTLGEQPTALQFMLDDITYIGDLSSSSAYWAAMISLAGIIGCFICTVADKIKASRIIAIIAELPMLWSLIDNIIWADGDFEDFWYSNGFGYWGIFWLFIVVIIFSRNTDDFEEPMQTDETENFNG